MLFIVGARDFSPDHTQMADLNGTEAPCFDNKIQLIGLLPHLG